MPKKLVPEPGLYLPTYRDRHGVVRTSAVWWFRIGISGKKTRVSTHLRDLHSANAWAIQKRAALGRGDVLALHSSNVDLAALCSMIETDYESNKMHTFKKTKARTKMLRERLGNPAAASLTTDRIAGLVAELQREGYADGSINLVLATLKRAYHLAVAARRLSRDAMPHIPMLTLRNARQGFFEPFEFEAILEEIPEDYRAVFRTAYITGWRIRSELLTRQWRHVDFDAGWLRLDPEEDKNRQGRMFYMNPSLRAVLEEQRRLTDALERTRGRLIPWVFWKRNGQPWDGIKSVWNRARVAAGFPDRLMHDMRRTAVRNMERSGVSRSAAMAMVGHKTEAIYRRYCIVDEVMLREGSEKLEAVLRTADSRKVTRLREKA